MLRTNLTTDVIVIGYGCAGAAASIAAHDAGARVLIIEKTPAGGGNAKYSGGTIRAYDDQAKATDHFLALTGGTVTPEMMASYVAESARNGEWLRTLGGEVYPASPTAEMEYPINVGEPRTPFVTTPGWEGVGGRYRVGTHAGAATSHSGGYSVFNLLDGAVRARNIEISAETRARRLLLAAGGDVIGVEVDSARGTFEVQARRGVVLACGGFEHNPEMQMNFLRMQYYPFGTTANTGDGIRMAQEIGADLWHMDAVACTFGYRLPGLDAPALHRLRTPGLIYVDQNGSRVVNEGGLDRHLTWIVVEHMDPISLSFDRIPLWMVFDESTRSKGPIANTSHGRISESYQWSADNKAEIEKGWITAAPTVRELGLKMGLSSGRLDEEVAAYNLACATGYDAKFGRDPKTLEPLMQPPFYAIQLWPCLYNTQGGPRRNERGQVLRPSGRPIPRLFSAGELGSIWSRFYPGAGNITEALASGRVAGRNAAHEKVIAS